MSLGREDVLRELELLPVWRLRQPVAQSDLPAIALPMAPDTSTETLTQQSTQALPETRPETVSETMPETIVTEPVIGLSVESEPAAIVAMAETMQPEASTAPLIQSAWFLLCPHMDDLAAQQLLENIVRALKLAPEELHIAQQPVKIAHVQSRFAVLFGLEAANTFLGTNHTDLASIRGQIFTHAEMRYVITHHPDAMLANPLLKKEVWYDLCLLLAEK